MVHTSLAVFVLTVGCAVVEGSEMHVEGPVTGEDGILTYTVTSPYQRKANAVEVLLPDDVREGKRYPVLYILPVNDGIDGPWGSGIQEAKRHNIHNQYNVLCVSPEYDYTPWFGDHPTDLTLRQESYLLDVVIPIIEQRFPVLKGKDGRLLFGFSKSGFGAITIFLRHLDAIGKAAAWDAPLTMKNILPTQEEMKVVFVSQENFKPYCIPSLVAKHAATLKDGPPRLVLVSNASADDSVTALHHLLDEYEIPHHYELDQKRKHDWRTGWFPVAARLLFAEDVAAPSAQPHR